MNRIAFCFALLLAAGGAFAQRNVLLLIADDLGTDYCGFYEDHQDTVDMPNIRALLARGVRFANASSNPVCSSTRAGILTGRYSFRTGVGNIVGGIGGSGALDTAEITIPKLLKRYNPEMGTANIGKWHLHQPAPAANLLNPNKMGYDRFEGPFIGQLPSFTNWTKYTNGVASTVTTYATTENVNNAVSWLKTQGSNPFFLWLAFNAPHSPYHLPPANLHSYALSGTQQDINSNPKAYFKASLQALDTEIGRLFDSLAVMGRLDSTDIIFIGDNGNSNQTAQIADLNRAKGTVYQYGTHVPFVIAGPSVASPGRASTALVNTADLFATVLELAGYTAWPAQIPANKPVDSKSLLPILQNQASSVRPWAFSEIFKVTPDSADGKSIRNADYSLIRFDTGIEEFYHLAVDPDEGNNLLLSGLSAIDAANYAYLCSEMTALVGNGSFCTPGVGVAEPVATQAGTVWPNPFSTRLTPGTKGEWVVLVNGLGQVVYAGNSLENQDFTSLPAGIYGIYSTDNAAQKLLKE